MNVSVCLITKNCKTSIPDCLDSLKDFLRKEDEVVVIDTGSTDGTQEVCRERGARVVEAPELCDPTMVELAEDWCPEEYKKFGGDHQFEGGWLKSFAEARNRALSEAENDICFWLDADDTLQGGAELRKGIDIYFDRERPAAALFIRYDYAHDREDEQCTTVLWRERVVDRREWEWKGNCHEVLIPKGGMEPIADRLVKVQIPSIYIKHEPAHKKSAGISDLRNYTILRYEVASCEESGEKVDPRTLYYLGNAARGLHRWSESVYYYRIFLDCSGSGEDRLSAALNAAACRFAQRRYWGMLEWGHRAAQIIPQDPRPLYVVARAYYHMRRFQECLLYTDMGRKLEQRESLHSNDPNSFDFYPTYFAAESHKELGNVEQAIHESEKLVALRPDLEAAKLHLQDMQRWAQHKQISESVILAAKAATNRDKAVAITQSISHPEILEDWGVGKLESSINKEGRAHVAVLCGNTHEAWGPKSIETGIGGSERMVAELAPRLQARGLAVSVYANTPKEQRVITDGVHWRHYTEFNPKLKRDYLVAWRSPETLRMPIPARKRYIWLHDTIDSRRFTPEVVELADKVIPLSVWHRRLYPSIPDRKIFVSRNGTDSVAIKTLMERETPLRNPKKILYSSSPDRGLVQALNGFQYALQKDSELELDILYGFNDYYYKTAAEREYGYIVTQDRHRNLFEFAEEVYDTVENIPNCRLLGRVPCHKVTEMMLSSGVWLYPSPFTEISCMGAMEAQATGMCVVASDTAALAETIDWTAPLKWKTDARPDPAELGELILEATRTTAADPRRSELQAAALDRFSLDKLADDWMQNLFSL